MTRAYRWQVEHTPWDEASRSSRPRMVIITTLTGCRSSVATHSAQSVSYESPTNPRIVLRSSRKTTNLGERQCLDDASATGQSAEWSFKDLPRSAAHGQGSVSCLSEEESWHSALPESPTIGRPPSTRPLQPNDTGRAEPDTTAHPAPEPSSRGRFPRAGPPRGGRSRWYECRMAPAPAGSAHACRRP
jgi:hypothetical protein